MLNVVRLRSWWMIGCGLASASLPLAAAPPSLTSKLGYPDPRSEDTDRVLAGFLGLVGRLADGDIQTEVGFARIVYSPVRTQLRFRAGSSWRLGIKSLVLRIAALRRWLLRLLGRRDRLLRRCRSIGHWGTGHWGTRRCGATRGRGGLGINFQNL